MYIEIVTAAACGAVTCYFIWVFSFGIYATLSKMAGTMTQRTQKLQRQMNLMLFAQTLAVFSSALIPLFILLVLMGFKLNVQGLGTLISLILSFIPALNPICTLSLVARFRKRAIMLLCCGSRLGGRVDNTTEVTNNGVVTKPSVFVV